MTWLANGLTFLRQNNLWNCAFKEMFGSELPHVAMVMNKYEFIDQCLSQFPNFAAVFIANPLLGKGIDKLTNTLQNGLLKEGSNLLHNRQAVTWHAIGKTAALYSNMASFCIAAPGLRNSISAKISKTTNFTDMVGLNGNKQASPEAIEKQAKQDFKRFVKFYGTGLGVGASLLGLSQLAIKKQLPVPMLLRKFHRKVGLLGGKYENLRDLPAVLFWAYPVYMGFHLFSRDNLETLETAIKAGGFALAFAVLPRTIERQMLKSLGHKTFPVIGSGKNAAFLGQLLSGLVFYTSLPTVSNLLFRRKRAAKLGLLDEQPNEKTPQLPASQPVETPQQPSVPLQHQQPPSYSGTFHPIPPVPIPRPPATSYQQQVPWQPSNRTPATPTLSPQAWPPEPYAARPRYPSLKPITSYTMFPNQLSNRSYPIAEPALVRAAGQQQPRPPFPSGGTPGRGRAAYPILAV